MIWYITTRYLSKMYSNALDLGNKNWWTTFKRSLGSAWRSFVVIIMAGSLSSVSNIAFKASSLGSVV